MLFQCSAGDLPLVVVGKLRLKNAAEVIRFDAAALEFGFDQLDTAGRMEQAVAGVIGDQGVVIEISVIPQLPNGRLDFGFGMSPREPLADFGLGQAPARQGTAGIVEGGPRRRRRW